ncbi:MAG: glycoside hydrolase family 2 TIM barrel-domain containing protein [Rikenellaceae bacterium]
MIKKLLFSTLLSLALFGAKAQEINSDWYFYKSDDVAKNAISKNFKSNDWEKVSIPHTYIPSGSDEVYRDQIEDMIYEGVGWYRKNLNISNELKNKRLFLRFNAAYIDSDVYINGEKIGNHKGGYSAFIFEITDYVKFGKENYISVRTDNTLTEDINPLGGGYVKFGGLTRPIDFVVKEPFCISPLHYASSGVYCKQLEVSKSNAKLEIETILNNSEKAKGDYKVVCSIIDSNNKTVATESITAKSKGKEQWSVKVPIELKNPRLWNGMQDPALYTVKVELYNDGKLIDKVTETTGFRSVAIDKDKGFFLNGESYPLRGVALHQYYPRVGSALTEKEFDEEMEGILDLGANTVRLSHYPHSKYRLDLCDKYGVVAYSEIAFIKQFYGTDAFIDNLNMQAKEMVYQLYNHPSIAIWGLFNEIRFDEFEGVSAMPIVEGINKIIKDADPSRPTCGVSWQDGKRNDIADLSGWNRYQGWYWDSYNGSPNDFSWIDQIRSEHPTYKLAITEYGGGGSYNHFDQNYKRAPYNADQFHPVDFYNYSHEEHWKEICKRPWLWGTYIWTMYEFLVPNYDQGRSTFIHNKGLVAETMNGGREPKDAYYFYKANWRKDCPVFHLAYKKFDVRLTDCAEVTVYSNLGEATLSVNGVDYGTIKNSKYSIYRWSDIILSEGENRVVVTATKDGKQYKEEAVWSYVPDPNKSTKFNALVESGSSWSVKFNDEAGATKINLGTGVPGEAINSKFDLNSDEWKSTNSWATIKLPLSTASKTTQGNWQGGMVYLTKDFTVNSDCSDPYIYLRQSATMSTANNGRITIAIDGVAVLTIEEGSEDYRLIPIFERFGALKAGKHTISVIANRPVKGGVLDVGLLNKK